MGLLAEKTPKVVTDVTEPGARHGAPPGPVDVQACAVDTVRSGPDLVVREEVRTG